MGAGPQNRTNDLHIYEIQGSSAEEGTKSRKNHRFMIVTDTMKRAQEISEEAAPGIEIHQAIRRDGLGYFGARLLVDHDAVDRATEDQA